MTKMTSHLSTTHKQETTTQQRLVDQLTALVGQPIFVLALFFIILAWITANITASHLGYKPLDPPPFSWLQGGIATGALLVASLIITTQRREDQLTSHRAQLILELVVYNDQKCSKIIELLEESRRDNPVIADRIDDQANAMSTPSDTLAVLKSIKS
ncbi:DUF1003 domain-containing protein [Acidocella facilis]|uniref:DUF1003 domain-containing protein n=1 Tax=Acidocella facilis TaxID=525 RepID=UPI00138E0741|nr:DUF1003 domain-containing protein [Acidocella facilis]